MHPCCGEADVLLIAVGAESLQIWFDPILSLIRLNMNTPYARAPKPLLLPILLADARLCLVLVTSFYMHEKSRLFILLHDDT